MKKLSLLVTAVLLLAGCHSVEPVGALKAAGDAMDGKPLFPEEGTSTRRPYTGHIPQDNLSSGLLQWKAE